MYAGHGEVGGRSFHFLEPKEGLLAEMDWLQNEFIQRCPAAAKAVSSRTKEIDALLNPNN